MSISADVHVLGGLTLHVELYAEDDYYGPRGYGIDGIYWLPKGRKGKYRAISQAMYDKVMAYDAATRGMSIVEQVLDAQDDGSDR